MNRSEWKRIAVLALLLALCAGLLAGCGADLSQFVPKPGLSGAYTDKSLKPVGEARDVPYEVENTLHMDGEVHSLTAQDLDNGSARFTLDYTLPADLNCSIASVPDGRIFRTILSGVTSGKRAQLTFDLTEAQINESEDGFELAFWVTGTHDTFHVLFYPRPVAEPREVPYLIRGELPAGGEIHSFTAQARNNGDTRYTLEYTLPADLNVYVDDRARGNISISPMPTKGGREKLVFDLSEEQIQAGPADAEVSFWVTGGEDPFSIFFYVRPLVSDANPVGESRKIAFETSNELQAEGARIYRITAQKLDNGCTRYTLEYTMPEGLNVHAFDPPNGERISLDFMPTRGGREELTFELSEKQTMACEDLAVNFCQDDDNRFFVSFRP